MNTATADTSTEGHTDNVERPRPLHRRILGRFESPTRLGGEAGRGVSHLALVEPTVGGGEVADAPPLDPLPSGGSDVTSADGDLAASNSDEPADRQASLVLLGGGGHAYAVLGLVKALAERGHLEGPVVLADGTWPDPLRFADRPVKLQPVDSIEAGVDLGNHLVTAGSPMARRSLAERAARAGGQPAAPLFHPDATINAESEAADGVVVMGLASLSARATVGAHTHVGQRVMVGHDTTIGSWCSIMPGACIGSMVTIGDGVLVGAGATILEGVTVGDDVIVAPGATVISDVEPGATMIGTPARPGTAPAVAPAVTTGPRLKTWSCRPSSRPPVPELRS